MPAMIKVNVDRRNDWLDIVQKQQDIYQRYGIQVTLAKELHNSGSDMNYVTVGLRFNIGPIPGNNNALFVPTNNISGYPSNPTSYNNNATSILPPSNSNEGLISKLEKLDELHRKGAISDDEYSKAKMKILGN